MSTGTQELTDSAKRRITSWLDREGTDSRRSWWRRVTDDQDGDDRDAGGALAEVRALGTILALSESNWGELHPEPLRANRESKSPDFALRKHPNWFVEVCSAQLHDAERERRETLAAANEQLRRAAFAAAADALAEAQGEASVTATAETMVAVRDRSGELRMQPQRLSATRTQVGSDRGFTMCLQLEHRRPAGPPKEGGTGFTQASAFNSKKKLPDQIPDGAAGILWMDLCAPAWGLQAKQAAPIDFWWNGMSLAGTHGIWHSFYGRQESVLFDEAGVAVGVGTSAVKQHFPGRFRDERKRKWSAAVLLFADGLVLFEHPNPLMPLPMDLVRSLIALPHYRPEFSYHRWSEDDTSLEFRLRAVDDALRFVAGELR